MFTSIIINDDHHFLRYIDSIHMNKLNTVGQDDWCYNFFFRSRWAVELARSFNGKIKIVKSLPRIFYYYSFCKEESNLFESALESVVAVRFGSQPLQPAKLSPEASSTNA